MKTGAALVTFFFRGASRGGRAEWAGPVPEEAGVIADGTDRCWSPLKPDSETSPISATARQTTGCSTGDMDRGLSIRLPVKM